MRMLCILLLLNFLWFSVAAVLPQLPEINDQFEENTPKSNTTTEISISNIDVSTKTRRTRINNEESHVIIILYKVIKKLIARIMSAPKITSVVRNIGTCMVNGAMEVISHYFPAPIIPLIASAAGMVIPFEPVVMLKQRMPVTSYRRAFNTAVNTFMNTFNRYKLDYDDDPYMTRRFNRRFMKGSVEKQQPT